MDLWKYFAKLKANGDALWDPVAFQAFLDELSGELELPDVVACVMLDGTKGGYVVPEGIPSHWTNKMFVDAITTNMAQKHRIEVVATYRMPENERAALRQVGASIFSVREPQTVFPSIKVHVDLKDSLARARYLVLDAVAKL